jgi:shikimate dehydrogenase
MPHKQAIIKHLDEIDPIAYAVGAVNTVTIENGKLTGYNTDADGFIQPLKARFGELDKARVAVVGSGGAARACVFALTREGGDVTIFARDIRKAEALAAQFDAGVADLNELAPLEFDILVNATPVGMNGYSVSGPLINQQQLKGVKFVYDLVTSPAETPLIREAKLAGIETLGGLEMLIAQAAMQFEIWTGLEADTGLMERSAIAQLK